MNETAQDPYPSVSNRRPPRWRPALPRLHIVPGYCPICGQRTSCLYYQSVIVCRERGDPRDWTEHYEGYVHFLSIAGLDDDMQRIELLPTNDEQNVMEELMR